MLLIGVALAIGALIGLAAPPSERRFKRPRARLAPLVGAGVVLQVFAGRLDDGSAVLVALAGFACLLAFAAANMHLVGMGVLIVGLGLNVFVMALNGGMPVRTSALVAADVVEQHEVDGLELRGPRHVERPRDRLVELGDIIPVPVVDEVVSFGDLILLVALTDVAAHLVRRRRRQESMSSASPVPSSGSQYSASPDRSAPAIVAAAIGAPARQSR